MHILQEEIWDDIETPRSGELEKEIKDPIRGSLDARQVKRNGYALTCRVLDDPEGRMAAGIATSQSRDCRKDDYVHHRR